MQTMPIIILNAGDYQGIFAVMHVGIKKQREENSAVINAANIVGKENEIGGGVMYVLIARFAFKIKDTLLVLPGMGTRRCAAVAGGWTGYRDEGYQWGDGAAPGRLEEARSGSAATTRAQ